MKRIAENHQIHVPHQAQIVHNQSRLRDLSELGYVPFALLAEIIVCRGVESEIFDLGRQLAVELRERLSESRLPRRVIQYAHCTGSLDGRLHRDLDLGFLLVSAVGVGDTRLAQTLCAEFYCGCHVRIGEYRSHLVGPLRPTEKPVHQVFNIGCNLELRIFHSIDCRSKSELCDESGTMCGQPKLAGYADQLEQLFNDAHGRRRM